MLIGMCYGREDGCKKLCFKSLGTSFHVTEQMTRSSVISDAAEFRIESEVLKTQCIRRVDDTSAMGLAVKVQQLMLKMRLSYWNSR